MLPWSAATSKPTGRIEPAAGFAGGQSVVHDPADNCADRVSFRLLDLEAVVATTAHRAVAVWRGAADLNLRFALIATSDLGNGCGYVARMNEDWLAVIVGLALLALVLAGAIPGSVIP